MKKILGFYKFLAVFGLLCVFRADGQQTVFNVPTADVLEKGKVYVELDAAFKTANQQNLRRFSSFVPRVVIGAGGNVEVGLNVVGNIQPGADATSVVPTVKYRFYRNEQKALTLYGGTNFFIPLRNRNYEFGSYSYVAAAKTLGKTRLTAGGFVFSKSVVAPNAARAGGQFAVEQTINEKVTLAADWFTGKHASGYFTPGVIYKPHPQVTTYFSYSIGNAEAARGNHYFLFELGYNF